MGSENFKPVTHCIFNLDGLLLNSEQIYRRTFGRVIARYDSELGKIYRNEVKMRATGKRPLDCLHTIIQLLNIQATPEQLAKQIKMLFKKRIQYAKFKPGAKKLLLHLASHEIPIAVASSIWSEMVETLKIRHAKIFSLFHHVVFHEDLQVKDAQPAPDILVICASRFDQRPPAEKCLVFEDSPSGVLAANRAKMQVVMVPDSMVTQEHKDSATLVIKSLEEFHPEDFGLPSYKCCKQKY